MSSPNKRLKTLRKSLKLTQAELGETIGLKGEQIKDIEIGKVKLRLVIVKILGLVHGVSSEWLLAGEEPMINNVNELSYVEHDYINKTIELLRNPDTEKAIKENIDSLLKVPNPLLKKTTPDITLAAAEETAPYGDGTVNEDNDDND
ncbi:MAG: helix-turn-helix transcriptional regulator [Thermodesulfobacteriota bacterium]